VVFDLTPNSQPKSGKYFNDASSTTLQLKNKNQKKKKRRNKWKTKKISNLFFGGLSFFRFFSAVVLNSFVV